jgi:hypothetical protein
VDLRERLGQAHSVEDVASVAAELKQRLVEAEATGVNPVADVVHNAASGDRPRRPIWFLQPKVRNRTKDEELQRNPNGAWFSRPPSHPSLPNRR